MTATDPTTPWDPRDPKEIAPADLLDVREPLQLSQLIAKDVAAYLSSIALALAAVAAVWAGLGGVTEVSIRVWLTVAVSLIPPFVVYMVVTRPKQAKARRLRNLGPAKVDAKLDYFRLTLWGQDTDTHFERADGVHHEIYDWLIKAGGPDGDPILFVDGLSGTGKSSLLVNYVARRAESELGWWVLTTRLSLQPERQIIGKLKTLWKQLPKGSDEWSLRDWFERASHREIAPPLFLVVIDQGEELLLLKEDAEHPHQFMEFVKEHRKTPLPHLLIVIGSRTEYIHEFKKLGLLTREVQRSTVPAFDEGSAQDFMARGLSNRDAAIQMARIGSAVDGLAGLVRPITLNMLGTIYRRDSELRADLSAARAKSSQVFERFIERRIQAGDLRELGPAVARQLVTNFGRRQPPSTELAIQGTLKCDAAALSSCLHALEADGLVRHFSSSWELAHEFLAGPMNAVLQRLENRWWHAVRPYLLPLLAVFWIVLLGISIPLYSRLQDAENRAEFHQYFEAKVFPKNDLARKELYYVSFKTDQPSDRAITFLLTKVRQKSQLYIKAPLHFGSGYAHVDWAKLFGKLATCRNIRSLTIEDAEGIGLALQGLEELNSLEELNFEGMEATELELRPLKVFNNLNSLGLSRGLTEAGLEELAKLVNLRSLRLTIGTLSDADLKELAALKQLQSLSITGGDLTDVSLKELAGLTKLRSLSLFGYNFTDAGMKELAELMNLEELDIPGGNFTDAGLKQLVMLSNLKSLRLGGTVLTDAGAKELARLNNLRSLSFYNTVLTDAGVKELAGVTTLRSLDVLGHHLTDAGLKELVGLKNLESLTLTGDELTDAGLKELVGLKNLDSLSLTGDKLTDAGLRELAGLKKLRSLSLYGHKYTDAGMKEVARQSNLESLTITSTSVTDVGVKELRQALPECLIEVY